MLHIGPIGRREMMRVITYTGVNLEQNCACGLVSNHVELKLTSNLVKCDIDPVYFNTTRRFYRKCQISLTVETPTGLADNFLKRRFSDAKLQGGEQDAPVGMDECQYTG